MSFMSNDWRLRRGPTNFVNNYAKAYHTDIKVDDMKNLYNDEQLKNLHLLPNPLMKNLGDTLPMNNTTKNTKLTEQPKGESTLSGITGFFAGMMHTLTGAMFRRPKSPDSEQSWQESNYKNIINMPEKFSDTKIGLESLCDKENLGIADQMLYIDSGSVEDSFEDAFSPEDFMRMHENAFIEYYIPPRCQNEQYLEVQAPNVKVEVMEEEKPATVQTETPIEAVIEPKSSIGTEIENHKDCVTSCEDKLEKLKELLKKRKPIAHTAPEPVTDPIPINPEPIEDLNFGAAFTIKLDTESSPFPFVDNDFDEISGRFRKMSMSSDDSFQIVFNDVPRKRLASDCDSEDSFIVFEDNNDCYTTNDVFSDSETESETDSDSDDGPCDLYSARTMKNLADDTLYDEVDCGRVLSYCNGYEGTEKKTKSAKKVTFSKDPPKVHVMRVWAFAARQARAGHWERYALDRERFKRRIADVEMAVAWVLKPQHRSRVVFQRFMPLWNAEKRREEAEKLEATRSEAENVTEVIEEKPKCTETEVNAESVTYVIEEKLKCLEAEVTAENKTEVIAKNPKHPEVEVHAGNGPEVIEEEPTRTEVEADAESEVVEVKPKCTEAEMNAEIEEVVDKFNCSKTEVNADIEGEMIEEKLNPTEADKKNAQLENDTQYASLDFVEKRIRPESVGPEASQNCSFNNSEVEEFKENDDSNDKSKQCVCYVKNTSTKCACYKEIISERFENGVEFKLTLHKYGAKVTLAYRGRVEEFFLENFRIGAEISASDNEEISSTECLNDVIVSTKSEGVEFILTKYENGVKITLILAFGVSWEILLPDFSINTEETSTKCENETVLSTDCGNEAHVGICNFDAEIPKRSGNDAENSTNKSYAEIASKTQFTPNSEVI